MSESPEQRGRHGLAYALAAFGAWGMNPLYFKAVAAVPSIEIVGHRVLWSMVFVAALVQRGRQWPQVMAALSHKRSLVMLAASGAIVGLNWLLYIHAVESGQVLESSLGYYMNPLANVLLGRVFFGERLNRPQMAAVLLATAGVLNLALAYGRVPWLGLSLAGTFAVYGLLRKVATVESVPGLFIETLLLSPLALMLLLSIHGSFGHVDRAMDLLLILSGPVTALPLTWFTHAARRLSLAVLGFCQYLSPTGQFLLAIFVFGEHFGPAHYVTFACIWTAVLIFTVAPRIQRVIACG
ncbi:MAG TPA: EamA family transporter RarD [Candidatus Udaeobacter sp.]|nr:EamA family transporter RarD [Candidatus Udaeobacter sp.]